MSPEIHPFTFDETVNSGDIVSVQCLVSKGDTPLNISWTLNGRYVNNMDGIITGSMNQRNSILTIESAQAHHTGEYSCLAQNSVGIAKYASYLNVNGTCCGCFKNTLKVSCALHKN